MAHFVRPVALADSLAPYRDEYEIHLYAPSRFSAQSSWKKFYFTGRTQIRRGRNLPGEYRSRASRCFPPEVLRAYVHEDCQLIRS